MKKPIILFRESSVDKEEVKAAEEAGFDISYSRILTNRLVIGRYSVLPFYRELEKDLITQKSELVNTYQMHNYIASFDYYHDIEPYTFKTWFDLRDVPDKGPFVVKGVTNSKKLEWNKKMFVHTKRDAVILAAELQSDSLISSQNIIVREFVPLEKVDEGLNGLPMSNEWRFFFYKGNLLTHGFYWSITEKMGQMDDSGMKLALRVADIVKENVDFYVIDIAKTLEGEWKVVELNDGSMSGLSECSAQELYKNLKKYV